MPAKWINDTIKDLIIIGIFHDKKYMFDLLWLVTFNTKLVHMFRWAKKKKKPLPEQRPYIS